MYKVSVIVPVYNTEHYLPACLASLAKQTLDNIEVIVVDNGSSDGSLAIAGEFAMAYPYFRVYAVGRYGGVSYARNYGAKHAQGEYLAFVDSDDEVEPTYCEVMYEKAVRDGNDIVICRYDQIEQNRQGTVFSRPITWKIIDKDNFRIVDDKQLLVKMNLEVWNKLFKRELISKIEFPEGVRFSQDFQFVIEACCLAGNIGTVSQSLYHYSRIHNGIVGRICEEKLDIIRSRRQTMEFLQSQNLLELFEEEYELLCARGIIGMYPLLLKKDNAKWKLRMRLVHETQRFLKSTFPEWRKNPYIKVLRSRKTEIDPLFQANFSPFYREIHLLWMILVSVILPSNLWDIYYRIDRKFALICWIMKRKMVKT